MELQRAEDARHGPMSADAAPAEPVQSIGGTKGVPGGMESAVWPPSRSLAIRVVVAGLLLGAVGAGLVGLRYAWTGAAPLPPAWPGLGPRAGALLGIADAVLFAPLLETALMVYLLLGLRWCKVPRQFLPVVSALIWALLHYITYRDAQRLWTLVPFYVFSVALLGFPKIRSNRAFLSVSAIHAIMNLVISLVTWALAAGQP